MSAEATEAGRILLVDDDDAVRSIVESLLIAAGHEVIGFRSAEQALEHLTSGSTVDVVLTDFRLEGISGLGLLHKVRESRVDLPVVVMSGYGSTEAAVEIMKAGAYDYIEKPVTSDILLRRLANAVRESALSRALRQARLRGRRKSDVILGTSPRLREVLLQVDAIARTEVTVAIYGESGTGKELVARAIHAQSRRASGPIVVINCAALPETLLESELFGHAKGAFTGAHASRPGVFREAGGGTLVLDEIGEIPLSVQAKLLGVLQTHEVRPLGGSTSLAVDVRVIVVTNRDLETAVREGRFREDLFYRVNVIPIHVPPLRERTEDIPLLAHHFLRSARERLGKPVPLRLSEVALPMLARHLWPGNVRELENVILRCAIACNGEEVLPDHVPLAGGAPAGDRTEARPSDQGRDPLAGLELPESATFVEQKQAVISHFEQRYLSSLLGECHGNASEASRKAGLDRKSFWKFMRRHRELAQMVRTEARPARNPR
jgi:DNA-binding NtrC family response regulator